MIIQKKSFNFASKIVSLLDNMSLSHPFYIQLRLRVYFIIILAYECCETPLKLVVLYLFRETGRYFAHFGHASEDV